MLECWPGLAGKHDLMLLTIKELRVQIYGMPFII